MFTIGLITTVAVVIIIIVITVEKIFKK